MSTNYDKPQINLELIRQDSQIVIVHTQWNSVIVSKLLGGCVETLKEYGFLNYKIVKVPGAFELPYAIRNYWEKHANRFEKPQVFIALGCVLRGETPHFEYISKAVTDGIMTLNMALPVPTIFGVLTVNTTEQAEERLGGSHGHKGREAALTALKMMEIRNS